MELGQKLGEGRLAEVFEFGRNRAIKLFRSGTSVAQVTHEYEIAGIVHQAGLPVAEPYELFQMGERIGIIYERITGLTLLKHIITDLRKLRWAAELSGQLHADLHKVSTCALPSQRNRMSRNILAAPLEENVKAKAMELLVQLPDGDSLCHGDFHVDNVIFTTNGSIIVDWENASSGSPLADFVHSSLILRVASQPEFIRGIDFRSVKFQILRHYMSAYLKANPSDRLAWIRWIVPSAINRLHEGIPGERDSLLRIIHRGISLV
ncbi:phosphotransferase family protein [Paenibacillus koleovorans]|uniref:phosphotransferase family protein n=1 Tax=Paenibacillus koleovorans TaxID=121608 RepID=UPI0013E37E24|nr:aminoglycoside phosphotransferase family protein [Paenibacillus koleovorans]